MVIHCGINLYTIECLRKQGYRYGGLVSKGGVSMVAWMIANNRENPLYEKFDRVVSILKKYDVVLYSATGSRAGAIHDFSDRAQIQELIINHPRAVGDRPRHGLPDARGRAGDVVD